MSQLKSLSPLVRHIALGIILLQLFVFHLSALDPDKSVDHYLLDEWEISGGIPSNTIHSITQTRDGYLWFATTKGLVRFDGMKFSIIDFTGEKVINSFDSTMPDTLFVDRQGILWIGSPLGLTSYRYQTGRFKTFTTEDGIAKDRIRRIQEDMKGNLWISFFSSYVNLFTGNKFVTYNDSHGLEGKKINAIIENQSGNILFGSRENGVFIFNERKFSRYPISGLDNYQIITMFEDQDGDLWIGTNNGLFRITHQDTKRFTLQDGLSNEYISTIIEDSDRNLWVGTVKGLNRVKKNQDGTIRIDNLLKQFFITSIFEDRERSLWLATYNSGIKRLKEGKFMSLQPLEAFPDEIFFSLYQNQEGDTWIGALGGKLLRCRDNQVIESLKVPGINGTGITSIAEDAKGNLWLGTNGKGVFQKKTGTFVRYTTGEGLADNVVSSIFKDSRGNLWLCTFDGVSVIHHHNSVIESLNSKNGLLGNRVHNVYEDKSQNIWIAADKGITVIKEGKLGKENVMYYLEGVSVTCIYEDIPVSDNGHTGDSRDSVVWLSTHGAGLKRLNLMDGNVVSYTTANGMTSNFIYQFLEDQQEQFWLMSDSGILRVNKGELNRFADDSTDKIHCTSFGISDGLKSLEFENEFSRNSALKTRDGEFWFITKKGISIVNPGKVRVNKVPPPVVIETVMFDEQPVLSRLKSGTSRFKGITDFQFHFTAPTFLSPEKIKFKYRLEGFDREWVFLPAGNPREARYKSLVPGAYIFRVVACNSEGVWNQSGDFISFTLIPFFYETLLFKIAIFFILAALAALGLYLFKKRPFEQKAKYKTSPLTPEFAEECIKKLKHLMENEKIYRETDISLQSLADRLSISSHLLSQVLNEKLNRNFPDFINWYRIEEAKKTLTSSRGAQQKIAFIAFEVGFNTQVAFYNAFKKYTNMTPAQYKKESGKKK